MGRRGRGWFPSLPNRPPRLRLDPRFPDHLIPAPPLLPLPTRMLRPMLPGRPSQTHLSLVTTEGGGIDAHPHTH